MSFHFDTSIDPKKPINQLDSPPKGWEEVDTQDYRKALFGFRTDLFMACLEWEEREIFRFQALQSREIIATI